MSSIMRLMTVENPGKQICVLDTNTLLWLSQIEIGGDTVIQWVLDDFCVVIPKGVFIEGKDQLPEDAVDLRTLYFTTIISRILPCDEYYVGTIEKILKDLPPQERPNVDYGEKEALSLALELSRLQSQYILLITDDSKAENFLHNQGDENQIGIIRNSFDIILFIYSRHNDEIPLEQTEIALRDLTFHSRNNSISTAHKDQIPDILFEKYIKQVKEIALAIPSNTE